MAEGWLILAAAGVAGLGLGVGLILGVYVVRMLRRWMRDEPKH